MAYVKGQPFIPQFVDPATGLLLASGTVEFYLTGTSTPTPYYTNSGGSSGGTSLTLGSGGKPATDIYFNTAITYKIVVKNAAGSILDTIDPFNVYQTSTALLASYTRKAADITTMLALTDLADGQIISVAGYHPDSVVGGGTFTYDSSMAQTAHNGGTIIGKDAVFPTTWANQTQLATWFDGPGAGTGCFVRVNASTKTSLRMWGAVGDENTDDTRAIIKAMIWAKGNRLTVPGGIYTHAELILIDTENTELVGEVAGSYDTTVGATFNYTGTTLAFRLQPVVDDNYTYVNNVKVHNLYFKVPHNCAAIAEVNNSATSTFHNLYFNGNSHTGNKGLKIRGGVANDYFNIHISGSNGASGTADYLGHGLYIQPSGGIPVTTLSIRKLYCHYNFIGMYAQGSFVTLYDSVLESNTDGFINADSTIIFNNAWFEANIRNAGNLEVDSTTIINDSHIDMYALPTVFTAGGCKQISINNTSITSSHANPELFSTSGALTDTHVNIDNTVLDSPGANFKFGSVNLSSPTASIKTMSQMRHVTYRFIQTGVAAATTYNPVPAADGVPAGSYTMPDEGHIISQRVYYTGTISAGNYDAYIYKNAGVISTFSNLTNTTSSTYRLVPPLEVLIARGDLLTCRVTTSAGFAATGGVFVYEIVVALGDDGRE